MEVHVASVLQQQGDQRGPSRLMAGAQPRARLPMEELVERHAIAPMRIALEVVVVPEHRPAAATRLVAEEDPRQAARQDVSDFGKRQPLTGSHWAQPTYTERTY